MSRIGFFEKSYISFYYLQQATFERKMKFPQMSYSRIYLSIKTIPAKYFVTKDLPFTAYLAKLASLTFIRYTLLDKHLLMPQQIGQQE